MSFILVSCSSEDNENNNTPKNIILLVGDGMGITQIAATEYAVGNLNITSMPYSGAIFTHSSNRRVGDSAAGATTLASGYKTNNGMLGMTPDGSPLQSIAHYANELGKSTALLSTCRVTHATPAGFGVHHESRGDEFIIAGKYVDSGIDMILGAGSNYFIPESEGGRREDERNLFTEMQEKGYHVIDDENNIDQILGQDKVIALIEGQDLDRYPERGDQMNRLTKSALEQLSQNPEGFFMMIEGSMIDWGSHDNDIDFTINELTDFDNVLGDVLEFARNDGNTLVVVTADHETGGLTLHNGEGPEGIEYQWATGGHSAAPVPIYSYGPSAEIFSGLYDNTQVARKMFSLWGKTIED
ncbi:MAG: alkaline phosphatase [Balneolales bacterium]